ncbi:MAG: hypothetical protein JW915_16930 [Chitinispirillaceae bacterium]|nr:hypothetical protein [Chitinispirillaceae bacterium]
MISFHARTLFRCFPIVTAEGGLDFRGFKGAVAGTSRKSECFKTAAQETDYKASENGQVISYRRLKDTS